MSATAATAPKQQVTAEDYFALPEGTRVQLIDGELIDLSPAPTYRHQAIAFNIASLLRQYVKLHQLGTVAIPPLDVILNGNNAVQPDVLCISAQKKSIIGDTVQGAPDLVVEVLSPSTARIDLTDKMRIYAEAWVHEYWIADPDQQTLRLYDNRQGTFAEFDYLSNTKPLATSKLLAGLNIPFVDVFNLD